jgi:hypothetical protein
MSARAHERALKLPLAGRELALVGRALGLDGSDGGKSA